MPLNNSLGFLHTTPTGGCWYRILMLANNFFLHHFSFAPNFYVSRFSVNKQKTRQPTRGAKFSFSHSFLIGTCNGSREAPEHNQLHPTTGTLKKKKSLAFLTRVVDLTLNQAAKPWKPPIFRCGLVPSVALIVSENV